MGLVGRIIKRMSPALHAGLVVLKSGEFEVFPPRRVYAEKHLHRAIKSLFASESGYFIEAGANNGVTRSNTYYLAKHCGWRGLLIEPIPQRAIECRQARPESTTVHAALVAADVPGATVELIDMDRMSMVASDANALSAREHEARFAGIAARYGSDATVRRHCVPARSLAGILAEQGNPRVDFFSLDVEGLELEVLRGLDFAVCAPRYILVEDWDKTGVADFLVSKGYRIHSRLGEKDTLFKRV